MPGSKITRLRAALASALLTFSLAAPALANDDWNRGYPVHRHDRSCDHDGWRGDRWRNERWDHGRWDRRDRHHGGRYYGDRRGRYERYGHEYYCRPCGRGWDGRSSFHRHLARQHHIPFWAFPRVIVETGWGWVYFG
jgi:hypothetical protein